MQLQSEIDILHTFKPNTVKFSLTVESSLISDLHGSMGVTVKSCRGVYETLQLHATMPKWALALSFKIHIPHPDNNLIIILNCVLGIGKAGLL